MTLVKWTWKLSVGVSSLDEDHRRLADLINQIAEAVKHQKGAVEIARLWTKMSTELVEHFAREEALLEHLAYPDFSAHWNHHVETNRALGQMAAFIDTHLQGGEQPEILTFLKHWYHNHVGGSDLELRDFFVKSGATDVEGFTLPRPWWRRLLSI